jgi:CheY-like chemotaxis protein
MLPTILCIAAIGLVLGLMLAHWLTLAGLSFIGSLAFAIVSPWDWLLVPTWFGLLAVFQLAYLGGTVARIRWSKADESQADAFVVMAESEVFHGEGILIVEDQPAVAAHLVQEIEAAHGHAVGPAASVADALAFIEAGGVDGAVLDVNLADGEARTVAIELMHRDLPFVIITGVRTPPDVTARQAEASVLGKPAPSSPIRSLSEKIYRAAKKRKPTLKAS